MTDEAAEKRKERKGSGGDDTAASSAEFSQKSCQSPSTKSPEGGVSRVAWSEVWWAGWCGFTVSRPFERDHTVALIILLGRELR